MSPCEAGTRPLECMGFGVGGVGVGESVRAIFGTANFGEFERSSNDVCISSSFCS